MNIYLLRHGETEWNREGRLQGRTDIALNQTGRMQMQQVADVMDSLRLGIDLIIASPLVRARESAEIVAERIKYKKENIVTEPLLIERCFGVGEGLTISEREEKYHGDNYPEMELFEDLISRAHLGFDTIVNTFADRQNILLVAHGAILYAMLTAITEGEIEYGSKMVTFDQGSIYRIKYSDAVMELERYKEEKKDFQLVYKK